MIDLVLTLITVADGPLFGLPLPEIWFGLVFFLLAMFIFLDGFDFGTGVLFATVDGEDRERLLAAIGPIWDGNEVWLVVFGGALFAAFPAVYATLFSRNYLLMFAILGALIVRGLSPEMIEQRDDNSWKRWWGRAFVASSALAPFLVGVFAANWLLGDTGLSVAGLVVGGTLVALCVLDGAAYLSLRTEGALRKHILHYGNRAVGVYLVLIVCTLGFLYVVYSPLREALLAPLTLGLIALSLAFAGVYVYGTRTGRQWVPVGASGGLVFGFVAVVARLLYPTIEPSSGLSIETAIVSTLPLNLMTVMMALLLPLVLAYFAVLYRTFSGPVESGEGY